MSYWALTVITNLITVCPVFVFDLLEWVWSNNIINCYTLRRFFVIHFLFPFVCIDLLFIHLIFLHKNISKCFIDLGVLSSDKSMFNMFIIKDLSLYLIITFHICLFCLFINYLFLIHPDNFIHAMIFITPTFIEPEWYFLPYYSILRSIPHKLIGSFCLIVALILFMCILCFIIFIHDLFF